MTFCRTPDRFAYIVLIKIVTEAADSGLRCRYIYILVMLYLHELQRYKCKPNVISVHRHFIDFYRSTNLILMNET